MGFSKSINTLIIISRNIYFSAVISNGPYDGKVARIEDLDIRLQEGT